MNSPSEPRSMWRNRITLLLAILILPTSLWGFGCKFREFILVATGEVDGAFALTPIVNYLLAALGFLCLFLWAALNGMFHDVERPKYDMLETERRLDAAAAISRSEDP